MSKENDRSGAWAKDRVFLATLGALLVLFHWKVLFQGQVYAALDSSRFFFPVWKWGWGVFAQGHIPLWNADAQFGVPHLADPQTACAYLPLWLLYLLLGPVTGFSMAIVLHHLWALLGFWSFSRGQGLSSKTAFLGSVTFGFSLHLVGSSWTPSALMAISWLPWVFWAAEKVFWKEKGGFLWWSLTWAMQLACGYPVLAYLTGLGMGAHYLWKGVPVREFSWVVRLLAAAMVAACYNLVWGLPFAEMLPLTNYSSGASKFHDLGWKDLVTFLTPFPQGHPLEPNDQTTPYWVGSFYLGLPVLGLLVWGTWRRVFRKTSPWLFLVFLVLSLGWLGVGKMLRVLLPGYSLVVHSGFWISILALYGVWMSMEAMDQLLEKYRKAGAWVWNGLVLVTLLTLVPTANGLLVTKDRAFFETPPKALPGLEGAGRVFFPPSKMAGAVRLQGENLGVAYETAKQNLVPNWPLAFGGEVVPFYNTLQLRVTQAWVFDAFHQSEAHSQEVLEYLGIRYVRGKTSFKDFFMVDGSSFSGNPRTAPRWFTVSKAKVSSPVVLDDLAKAAREKLDYGKECFVGDPGKAGHYSRRDVIIVSGGAHRFPNFFGVSLDGHGRALLVSSDTAYPGWKATAWDDKPRGDRPLEVINHAFRGVVFEEGDERMLFEFSPVTFRLGLFLALLVLGLWSVLLLNLASPFEEGGPRGN